MQEYSTDKKRVRKALRIVNRILLSYILLNIGKSLFGQRFYDRRVDKKHERNAKRAKKGISELKGLFTKVGQLLSMMSNVLPKAYAEVLESLQDKAPPSPFEDTQTIIEEDLGKPLGEVFESFDAEPIASASIGQVYKAKLKTGEEVAVKVQHKHIQELAKADLEIIRKMIKRVNFFLKIEGIFFVYQQVKRMVLDELDFNKERLSMEQIRQNISSYEGVEIPKVYIDYCSSRIITTGFQNAAKITDIEQLDEWKIDRKELAERLLLVYCQMILEDGFYHADPHPGNVFVKEDGTLVLLDFGATAVLNDEMRKEIPILVQAAVQKNHEQVVSSLQKMGFVGEDGGSRKVAKKIVSAVSNFMNNEINAANLNMNNITIEDVKGSSVDKLRKELSIRELSKSVRVPKDWVLLDRTLILISGISATIAPDLDPLEVIKPFLKKQLLKPENIKNWLLDTAKKQLSALITLPDQLSSFLKKANAGDLEIEVKSDTNQLYKLGQQFILVLFILASVVFYYLSQQEAWVYISGLLSFFLLRSMWKNRKG